MDTNDRKCAAPTWRAWFAALAVLALGACGGGGGGSGSAPGGATIADSPGHHWDLTRPASPPWNSVAHADGGGFVAVGSEGAIAQSGDGIAWTLHGTAGNELWVSAAYGSHGWVVVSQTTDVIVSPDGVTWTPNAQRLFTSSEGAVSMSQVAFGNGVYVAVGGGGAWVSPDGVGWTAVNSNFTSIAFGNGLFVAAASDGLYTSPDGSTWTFTGVTGTAGAGGNIAPQTVGFGNGLFVANDLLSTTYVSTDGIVWAVRGAHAFGGGGQLDYAGGAFYEFDVTEPDLFSTTTGAEWIEQSTAGFYIDAVAASATRFVGVSFYGDIASGPDATHLVEVVQAGFGTLLAVDQADGFYIAVAEPGAVLTSADGHAWTAASIGPTSDGLVFQAQAVAHAPDGTIVVTGSAFDPSGSGARVGAFAWSSDGLGWTLVTTPGGGVGAVIHDGTRFLALGNAGAVQASADGKAWTVVSGVAARDFQFPIAIAHGGGRYVIVGWGGLTATSTDGVQWTVGPVVMDASSTTPGEIQFEGVVYDGRHFVAVANFGAILTSIDGLAWSQAGSATGEPMAGIAVSPAGVLVAVGGQGVVESSDDGGASWTLRTAPASQSFYAVAAVPDGFVAVGDDSLVMTSTH